jgi:hypothetical protein
MKVKLYVEGLNAWKSRRWITSKKEFDLLLNILIGGMMGNQEYTFFIKFRVCGSPLWTTYKVFQFLPGSGWHSYNAGTEDEARDMVSGLLHEPHVSLPVIPDNTMNVFKAFFKKL